MILCRMLYNLVIVESPAKCSKIQEFLGNGWKVLASMGHIRHLVENLKALHIDDGFKPEYEFMKDKSKTITQLKEAAKSASKIYLASDDDREGEAIAYSVALALKLDIKKNPRIVFHQITKQAIIKAVESPRTINMNTVYSQQARAVLDLMVGFMISPLLWKYVAPSLSAGRCQTPALRLVVEKEQSIENFKGESAYAIKGTFTPNIIASMIDTLESEEDALNYLENVHDDVRCTIINIITKPTKHNPPLPLITSTLQQDASALYGSNPKNTMRIAQKLYENGLITYMRTDCATLSEEAILDAKKQVETTYGKEYVNSYDSKKSKSDQKTQDAHEAIRPTHFETTIISDEYSKYEKNIYTLIYKRAIQSVMSPSVGDERKVQLKIDNDPNEFLFESTYKRTTFQGWKIIGQSEADLDEKEEEELSSWKESEKLKQNMKLEWKTLKAEQKFTSPPSRFNEATLVRDLEKKGIGRPSTFASLVATILDKQYVEIKDIEPKNIDITKYELNAHSWPPHKISEKKLMNGDKKKMCPTVLGKRVNEFCIREFSNLFNYDFTKHMEDSLDSVEKGTLQWEKVCKDTLDSYKEKYDTLNSVSSKEISNTKKKVLKDGYEAVITRNGPCLIKDKKFLGWPKGVDFKDITDTDLDNFLQNIDTQQKEDIFGYIDDKPVYRKTGKFGDYVSYEGKNISLKPGDTIETITKRLETPSNTLHTLGEYVFKSGQYGKYMMKKSTAKGKKPIFVSIPSELDVTKLTEEAAKNLYENGKNNSKPKKFFKKKE